MESEEAISMAEAKEILSKIVEERGELAGYEQKITLDFLKACVPLSGEDARKMKDELKNAIPELKDHQIAMIINILPMNDEDVKIIFAKERLELSEDMIKKILEIVDKYRPEEIVTYKAFSKSEKSEEEKAKSEENISEESEGKGEAESEKEKEE